MKEVAQKTWDVIVIGGGPAGMMAAGRAAERGAKVLLLEKNPNLGKKLLITGGGRCNLTNAEFNTQIFLDKFKESKQYLFSAFSQWNVEETIEFFNSRGMETKVENNNRVFPVSDSAQSVWNILVEYTKQNKVIIRTNSTVSEILSKDNLITGVKLKDGTVLKAKSYVLATGGKSRPDTGSTGDGFVWLKSLGHSITEPKPYLVPITTNDLWVSKLSGISLEEVKINVIQNNKRHFFAKGKILFTHFGLSGPTVLNMSRDIAKLLKKGEVTISLDLFPILDHGTLDQKIQELFKEHSNKLLKNTLTNIIPSALASVIISLLKINTETKCHSVTREDRSKLIHLLKDLPLSVKGLLGVNKAIVTSGGVSLNEIDFKTMSSRLYKNLYLVGDILDINRPSGGYSLQLCWTTGYVAGNTIQIN